MTSALRNTARPFIFAALLSSSVLSLTACAPLIVGGAAVTTVAVVTDRRTTGIQLEDNNIALKAENRILQELGSNTTRINATAYNRRLLLTGDVATEEAKQKATEIAKSIDNIISVNNQMQVRPLATFSIRSNDTWMAFKVKSALLNTKYVPSGTIAVTVDRNVVFLIGLVTQTEGEYAASAAANINGVDHVVKYFEIISREEAVRLGSGLNSNSSSAGTPQHTPAATEPAPTGNTDSGVQAMPIQ